MYTSPNPYIDKYKLMQRMLDVLLPAYVIESGKSKLALQVIEEFANMEQARQTIVGVDSAADAITGYLDFHFKGAPKPFWYSQLTQ